MEYKRGVDASASDSPNNSPEAHQIPNSINRSACDRSRMRAILPNMNPIWLGLLSGAIQGNTTVRMLFGQKLSKKKTDHYPSVLGNKEIQWRK